MKQWILLFSKEQKEMVRNFKWVWVPLVFIILGMMQPITSYYLPDILKKFGGLPEGATFEIPIPTAAEVMIATLSQYSQLGILILVLATMGVVASERSSGSFIMILVKPVSFTAYITAKWASTVFLAFISFSLGYVFAAYYTHILIGELQLNKLLAGLFTYGLWLAFVMTLTVFFSSILKGVGTIAFAAIGSTIVLSIVTSVLSKVMYWSPARLSTHSQMLLLTGNGSDYFWLSITVTLLSILLLLILSVTIFKKKELVS